MDKEKRTEYISSRVTPSIKESLKIIKKEYGFTPADMLEMKGLELLTTEDKSLIYQQKQIREEIKQNNQTINSLMETVKQLTGRNDKLSKIEERMTQRLEAEENKKKTKVDEKIEEFFQMQEEYKREGYNMTIDGVYRAEGLAKGEPLLDNNKLMNPTVILAKQCHVSYDKFKQLIKEREKHS